MSGKFSLDDYIDVAERIVLFKEKYPDGTLQTIDWKVVDVAGKPFVVYHAAAFRTAEDERPGHGIAWEPFPGPTPYTKDSELMNAETAAWGRAIVAVGLAANRKIASRQEVRARQGSQEAAQQPPRIQANGGGVQAAEVQPTQRLATAKQRGLVMARASELGMPASFLANLINVSMDVEPREFTDENAARSYLQRALDRLPASKIDKVLENIAAEAV